MNPNAHRSLSTSLRSAAALLALALGVSLAGCRQEPSNAVKLSAEVLDRCTGEFQPDPKTQVRVTREGKQLGLTINGRDSLLFVPESSTSFRHPPSGTRIQFPTNAAGLVTRLVLIRGSQTNEAPRITASAAIATQEAPAGPEGFRFQVTGSGDTTVVLWGSAEDWRSVRDDVARVARVVTWTRVPATGGTWPIPRTPSETIRALHSALTREVPARSFIFVGHSFGGALARVYAASHTNGIAGLVLVDPFQEGFVDWLQSHQPENHRAFLVQMHHGYVSDWPSTRAELLAASSFASIPVIVLSAAHRAVQTGNALEAGLEKTAMAAGSEAVVAAHREWVSRIPGGKQLLVEGASHDIPHEQPQSVANAIRTIVDRLQSSRP